MEVETGRSPGLYQSSRQCLNFISCAGTVVCDLLNGEVKKTFFKIVNYLSTSTILHSVTVDGRFASLSGTAKRENVQKYKQKLNKFNNYTG